MIRVFLLLAAFANAAVAPQEVGGPCVDYVGVAGKCLSKQNCKLPAHPVAWNGGAGATGCNQIKDVTVQCCVGADFRDVPAKAAVPAETDGQSSSSSSIVDDVMAAAAQFWDDLKKWATEDEERAEEDKTKTKEELATEEDQDDSPAEAPAAAAAGAGAGAKIKSPAAGTAAALAAAPAAATSALPIP